MFPRVRIVPLLLAVLLLGTAAGLEAQFWALDPGVREGDAGAGGPIDGVSLGELAFFVAGREQFEEVQSVQGTLTPQGMIPDPGTPPGTDPGLGPRFNLDSCGGCHAQPATGGTSPSVNPQVAVANLAGATNRIPFFVKPNGPVREARFQFKPDGTRDGGVHNLFTISGRLDAPRCNISQPNFDLAAAQYNLIFRIPSPVFGAGLIEAIPDATIIENKNANYYWKLALGISGRENRSGNDGTITRFGWKAQNKSLEIFAGEAYNVEQGVTNDLFPQERDETPSCRFNATPESRADLETGELSDVTLFAVFMRFLAPPTPAAPTSAAEADSIARGRAKFESIGCALCHTPSLQTGKSASPALSGKDVNLFSDLLLHNMGPGLADDILQGNARGDEFRTAPLWGLGQRIFFLHDGRTTDLRQAIMAHKSWGNFYFRSSEANVVIDRFDALGGADTQDIFNFLRSL